MVHIRKRVQNVLVVVSVIWCIDQPKGHVLFTLKNGSNRSLQPLVRQVHGDKNIGLRVFSKITSPSFLENEIL